MPIIDSENFCWMRLYRLCRNLLASAVMFSLANLSSARKRLRLSFGNITSSDVFQSTMFLVKYQRTVLVFEALLGILTAVYVVLCKQQRHAPILSRNDVFKFLRHQRHRPRWLRSQFCVVVFAVFVGVILRLHSDIHDFIWLAQKTTRHRLRSAHSQSSLVGAARIEVPTKATSGCSACRKCRCEAIAKVYMEASVGWMAGVWHRKRVHITFCCTTTACAHVYGQTVYRTLLESMRIVLVLP